VHYVKCLHGKRATKEARKHLCRYKNRQNNVYDFQCIVLTHFLASRETHILLVKPLLLAIRFAQYSLRYSALLCNAWLGWLVNLSHFGVYRRGRIEVEVVDVLYELEVAVGDLVPGDVLACVGRGTAH